MKFLKILILLWLLPHPVFISSSFSMEDTQTKKRSSIKIFTRDEQALSSDLSPIKEENAECIKKTKEPRKKINLLKLADTKEINLPDKEIGEYFTQIKKSIKKCNEKRYEYISKMIIYSYPIFTNEDDLFKFLITQKEDFPSFMTFFLRQLLLEGIPNGVDNLVAAENSFNNLKDGLVDDPLFSCLFQNKLECTYLDITTLPKLSTTGVEKEWFDRWGITHLIDVLTQRDINLYCAITFADLKSNLENQSLAPDSILAITNHFDRTVNWICFEILKKKRPRERTKMAQLFRIIGRMLHIDRNFHGAFQVALAFNKVQLSRILSPQEREELMDEEFMKDIHPNNNYKKYRELLTYPSSKFCQLPIFPVFLKDILFAYEMKSFEVIGELMEKFNRSKRFLRPRMMFEKDDLDALKFVSHLPNFDDSILDEMSHLVVKWPVPRKIILPQNLEDWELSHFSMFLEKHNEQLKMYDLLAKNIFSGQDFVAYLKRCSSFKEADHKLNQIGFTQELRDCLLNEVHKKLSEFITFPTLRLSKTRSEMRDFEKRSVIKSKSYKRQRKIGSRERRISVERRSSFNVPEMNQDFTNLTPRETIRHKKKDEIIFSEGQSRFLPSETLSFWEVYLAYVKNKTRVYPWGRMEGSLLSSIKTIADQWRIMVPDREPTFNIDLFLLKKTVMFERNDPEKRRSRKKIIKVDYSFPVSFPVSFSAFNSNDILTVYFNAFENDDVRVSKGNEEDPHELIQRLRLWENNEGEIMRDVFEKLESKKSMPFTPHDFTLQRLIEISDVSPKKFIDLYYDREKRKLDFSRYQFRAEELFSLLVFLPKDMLSLDMSYAGIRKAELLSLAPFIPDTLRELNLSHNRIGDMAVMTLMPNLSRNLEILDLSHNRIGDVALLAIALDLPDTLKKLFLGGNKITNKGVKRLFSSLSCQLSELDLSYTLIDDTLFHDMTPTHSFPNSLNLSHTKIGDESLMVLLEKGFNGLNQINLEGTSVGEKGWTYLQEKGFVYSIEALSLWQYQIDKTPEVLGNSEISLG